MPEYKHQGDQPNPQTPVTLEYLYNHLFQVMGWLNYLNNEDEVQELSDARNLVLDAQNKIGSLIDDKKETK